MTAPPVVVSRWQCINCSRYLASERKQNGDDPQVCIECRQAGLNTLSPTPGIAFATGAQLAEHHARTTIAREKQLGLEPLGIRATRHSRRRYSAFKIVRVPMAREVLPISSGMLILPGQMARITSRPQRVSFTPERLFIAASGTIGGAADWVVDDILIDGRSQFAQDGQIPGNMFATAAIDMFVSFEAVNIGTDIAIDVTYVGANPEGAAFFGSLVGRSSRMSRTGGWVKLNPMTAEQAAEFWPMHSASSPPPPTVVGATYQWDL